MSDKATPFSQLSTETAWSCRHYRIRHDRYVLPDGQPGDYFIVDTHGSVMVIPQTTDGRFVMVKQYRYIPQEWMVEFPCGGIHAGEEPVAAAAREAQEEAGVTGQALEKIGEFLPFNGVASEVCFLYHLPNASLGANQTDVDEELTVELYTAQEIDTLIAGGQIRDGMTLAAWQLFCAQL